MSDSAKRATSPQFSWDVVSGNTSPSKLLYFRPEMLQKYDFFRLLVKTVGSSKSGLSYYVDEHKLAQLFGYFDLQVKSSQIKLYNQGDKGSDMRILLKGAVRLEKDKGSTNQSIVKISKPGERFGQSVLGGQDLREETAVTVAPSTFLVLSVESFFKMSKDMPEVANDIEQALDGRKGKTVSQVAWLGDSAKSLIPFLQVKTLQEGEQIYSAGFSEYGVSDQALYIISDGKIALKYASGFGGESVRTPPDTFGTLGFLYACPRIASATALERCVILKLDHDHWKSVLEANRRLEQLLTRQALRQALQCLRTGPLFSCIMEENWPKLANMFSLVTQKPGTVVWGDGGFSVLVSGDVVTDKATNGAVTKRGAMIGSWFGQEALLGVDVPGAQATATANGHCLLLRLPRDRFTDFLQLLPNRQMFEKTPVTSLRHNMTPSSSSSSSSSSGTTSTNAAPSPATKETEEEHQPLQIQSIADYDRTTKRISRFARPPSSSLSYVQQIESAGGQSKKAAEWEYLDRSGKKYGPFPSEQMRKWHHLNYLLPEVPVRCCNLAHGTERKFVPLEKLFSKPLLAFTYVPEAEAHI